MSINSILKKAYPAYTIVCRHALGCRLVWYRSKSTRTFKCMRWHCVIGCLHALICFDGMGRRFFCQDALDDTCPKLSHMYNTSKLYGTKENEEKTIAAVAAVNAVVTIVNYTTCVVLCCVVMSLSFLISSSSSSYFLFSWRSWQSICLCSMHDKYYQLHTNIMCSKRFQFRFSNRM